MDAKFDAAISAIKSGDVDRLHALVQGDTTLATSRSSTSHPTLLQCLVLDAKDNPKQLDMISSAKRSLDGTKAGIVFDLNRPGLLMLRHSSHPTRSRR